MKHIWLLVVLLSFILSACRPSSQDILSDLTQCSNASQSCWHSIYIGKTTVSEAQSLLETDREIINLEHQACQPVMANPLGDGLIMSDQSLCWDTVGTPKLHGCADAWDCESDEPIQHITLVFAKPELTVRDLMESVGQPIASNIYIRNACGMQASHGFFMDRVVGRVDFNGIQATTEELGVYNRQRRRLWQLTSDLQVVAVELVEKNGSPKTPQPDFPMVGPELEWGCSP